MFKNNINCDYKQTSTYDINSDVKCRVKVKRECRAFTSVENRNNFRFSGSGILFVVPDVNSDM